MHVYDGSDTNCCPRLMLSQLATLTNTHTGVDRVVVLDGHVLVHTEARMLVFLLTLQQWVHVLFIGLYNRPR